METALAMLGIAALSNFGAINAQILFYPGVARAPPLRDFMHSILPNLSKDSNLDMVSVALPIIMFASGMVVLKDARRIKFIQQLSLIIFIKAVLIVSTALPGPRPDCRGYTFYGVDFGGCRDMNMSVHTAMAALVSLHIVTAMPKSKYYMMGLFALVVLAILLTRHHYTADIVLGLTVAFFVYGYFENHEFPNIKLPSVFRRNKNKKDDPPAVVAASV